MRTEPLPADVADLPLDPFRPVRPSRGIGRLLRGVIGVREDILDWVPEERSRYARLGAIVLNTGVLAAVSLLVALTSVAGDAWPLLIPVAALWGWVIVTLDGWLIASTHGARRSRSAMFIPRLMISVLLGVAIAEPLVMLVFRPAIHQRVYDNRRADLDHYEAVLKTCNPPSGVAVTTPECAGHRLNVPNPPDAVRTQLRDTTAKRDQLKSEVDAIAAHWNELETTARNECGGARGTGLTGIRGNGSECKRNREIADRYRADSRLPERQAELASLDAEVVALTARAGTVGETYVGALGAAIAARVAEKKSQQGEIGILEEFRALADLSEDSVFVTAAHWVLRLLLIAVDCMPVLAKFIGGTTGYDDLVARQLEANRRLHDKHVTVYERRDAAIADIRLERTEQFRRTRIDRVHEADRAARARQEADDEAQIERLAARLREQGAA